MKIYAPVKDANGVWATVRFINGVGETDNPSLIKWFESHGYVIEDTQELRVNSVIETQNEVIEVKNEVIEETTKESPNFEDMTPNELRDWAKANGKGGVIKNTRNKEKLIELLRG